MPRRRKDPPGWRQQVLFVVTTAWREAVDFLDDLIL